MDLIFRLYALLFARPFLYRLNRALFHLALRGLGILNWRTERLRGEADLLERLLSRAPQGAVVLDVGANEGDYSETVLRLTSHVDLHAFEPHPETFERLAARLRSRNARCHNFALGAANEQARLFDYREAPGSSHASLFDGVIERIHRGDAHSQIICVRRLDSFLHVSAISHIYLLKIDVEGAEANVLVELGDALDQSIVIDFVQIEFNEMNVVSRTFLEDLTKMLPGYRTFRILPRGRLLDITDETPLMREIFAFQNILFSRTPLS